jgi:DNA polymerase-1
MGDVANIKLRFVANYGHVEEFFNWLGNRREFLAVDVETTGLIVGHDYIRLAQFGDGETGWAFDYSEWKGAVRDAILRYDRPMVAHNLLFDSKMLLHDGIEIPQHLAHDSMVMTHLADPKGYMGLKPAAARYIDKRAAAGQDLLKKAMALGGWTWETIPTHVPAYWQYSAFDTCLSALMAEKLYPDTKKAPYETELAVIHCLRDAELQGLRVDEGYRQLAEWKLRDELAALTDQLPIKNPRSNEQVIEYLHSIGAKWEVYNEDTGQLSTDKNVLKWLASEHGGGFTQAGVLGEWRKTDRLLNSYIRKFADIGKGHNYKGEPVGLGVNGILHPSTRPVAARTGRMSVTDPPLQTLPRGRVVRDASSRATATSSSWPTTRGWRCACSRRSRRSPRCSPPTLAGKTCTTSPPRSSTANTSPSRSARSVRTAASPTSTAQAWRSSPSPPRSTSMRRSAFRKQYDEMFPGIKGSPRRSWARSWRAPVASARATGTSRSSTGAGFRSRPTRRTRASTSASRDRAPSCSSRRSSQLDHAGLGPYFRLPVHDELIYECPIEDAPWVRKTIEEVMPDENNFPGVTLEVESDVVCRWGMHYDADFPQYIPVEDAQWLRDL